MEGKASKHERWFQWKSTVRFSNGINLVVILLNLVVIFIGLVVILLDLVVILLIWALLWTVFIGKALTAIHNGTV